MTKDEFIIGFEVRRKRYLRFKEIRSKLPCNGISSMWEFKAIKIWASVLEDFYRFQLSKDENGYYFVINHPIEEIN